MKWRPLEEAIFHHAINSLKSGGRDIMNMKCMYWKLKLKQCNFFAAELISMERTRKALLPCRKWMSTGQWKLMTSKASNRAAVHGVKLPVPDAINKDEVQREIQKAKEEKEARRKQIEKTVESYVNSSPTSDHSSDG